jgi:hypothetical protein
VPYLWYHPNQDQHPPPKLMPTFKYNEKKFAIRPDLYQSNFGLVVTIYWNFLTSKEYSLVSAVLVMSIPTKTNTLLQSWCPLLDTMKTKFAIRPDLYQSKFGLVVPIYWNFLVSIECSLVSAILVISSQPTPTPWCCKAYIYFYLQWTKGLR